MSNAPDEPDTIGLPAAARAARMVAAAVVLVLLSAGTLRGQDDDFPFGPQRMYATRDDPNGAVSQAVVLGVTADGRSYDVTDSPGAPRRAELEGRFERLQTDPVRFAAVGALYVTGDGRLREHPAVRAVEIRLVRRSYPLRAGRSGPAVDKVVARWRPER